MEIAVPDTEDADRLTELWLELADSQRAFGSHLLVDPNREVVRESVLRHVVAESILVARGDSIAGFVMFTIESDRYARNRTRGLIQNLYVRPAHRDDSVGSSLLEAAHERLAAAGADVVSLEVMASNEDARRFYRRHGYDQHRLELEKPLGHSSEE